MHVCIDMLQIFTWQTPGAVPRGLSKAEGVPLKPTAKAAGK